MQQFGVLQETAECTWCKTLKATALELFTTLKMLWKRYRYWGGDKGVRRGLVVT